ncbi:MAG: DNA-3-methyladenine glycosylase [Candidatus Dormibacteraeota bacterium]|nr:DNA-3-methyladenine glycosylase [Candidatus Dormibacteraeota bacterium]
MAQDLVGAQLLVDPGTADEVRATIIEAEAYLGPEDPASHAFRGPTPRASIMFGPAGHLYVYLSYGMHHCANVVCGPDGSASAVLLRAASVTGSDEVVRRRRATTAPSNRLLSGPGNLCRGLAIGARDNGLDLCRPGRIRIEARSREVPVSSGPRVGITQAADLPLRFWWTGHPAVSKISAAQATSRRRS